MPTKVERDEISKKLDELIAVAEGKTEFTGPLNEFLNRVRKNIDDYDFNASGNLRQSLNALPTRVSGNKITARIEIEDYWQSLEKGLPKGTKVPVDAIVEWLMKRAIPIKPLKSIREMAVKSKKLKKVKKQMATLSVELIRRKIAISIVKKIEEKGTIKRFGYKGKPFLTKEIPQLEKDIIKEFQP